MLNNAKNGVLELDGTDMDYISFGNGSKYLIMIPGLGDGLKTVKGMALPFSVMYKCFTAEYTVFSFSRKNKLEEGHSTKDMAADIAKAMELLGIPKADVLGVSQGGMISQYLAIDFPEKVNKLVLAVTISKPNDTVKSVVGSWIEMAKADDYKSIYIDMIEKIYSEKYQKRNRLFLPFMTAFGKPKDFSRFIIMAEACITHNSYDELEKIKCPTLIIGGKCDKIVTGKASEEIAEKISDSEIFMYDDLGHSAYEESPDFNKRVLDFLNK